MMEGNYKYTGPESLADFLAKKYLRIFEYRQEQGILRNDPCHIFHGILDGFKFAGLLTLYQWDCLREMIDNARGLIPELAIDPQTDYDTLMEMVMRILNKPERD